MMIYVNISLYVVMARWTSCYALLWLDGEVGQVVMHPYG
jgi:hypothetical protein